MSVGYSTTKADIDGRVGNLVQVLRDTLASGVTINAWLLATPDATLVAQGYTAGEVAILKSAFADIAILSAVAKGTQAQASTKNFFAFAGQLTGLV